MTETNAQHTPGAHYQPSEQNQIRANPTAYLPRSPIWRIGWGRTPVALLFRAHPNDPDPTENQARLIAAVPDLLDFAIQYLWSEHGECHPTDEACPFSPEQLGELARKVIAEARGREVPE